MFILLSIWISVREFHQHTPGGSDDLPGRKNVHQAKGLDLLPVFHCPYQINLEKQKQVVSQQHQLEDGFTCALFFRVLAQNDCDKLGGSLSKRTGLKMLCD
jgi:hypothetical protein